jgi:glycosyltransferase involved in cell wall biosynthesis
VRIVSVMTSRTRGGAEHAAVWLLDALAARGHDVRLLTSHPDLAAGRRLAAHPLDLGPKLGARSWPALTALSPLLVRRLTAALEREAPYDVLLLHFKKEQLLVPLLPARLRPRVAWAEWGPIPAQMRSGPAGRLYRRAARDVAAVLAVSEGTRRSLIAAGMAAARIEVVPNVIDLAWARPDPDAGTVRRRSLGIPGDAFLIGCLTRFIAKKRNEVAIDAVVRLAGEPGPPVHLLMMGEGETEDALRARAAPLRDAAHFAPSPGPAAPQWLSACDAVLFSPSPTEGEPLAIVLGQLTAKPVVATAAEGAAGLIEPGAGAIASPEHDPLAVAVLLAGYRADPARAEAEGRRARELALARHDPDALAARAERLLTP